VTPKLSARDRVYAAALDLFVSKGYDGTTMDDIAAAAGVARRSVFNYFPAKADIAVEWAVRRGQVAALLAREVHASAGSGPGRVRRYFHEMAAGTERNFAETHQMVTGWMRGYGAAAHRALMGPEILEWLRDVAPGRSDDELWLAVQVLFDVFQGVLLRRMQQAQPAPDGLTAEVDAVVEMVLTGLAAAARESGSA
jgi:AcrR family transcriptional regulator